MSACGSPGSSAATAASAGCRRAAAHAAIPSLSWTTSTWWCAAKASRPCWNSCARKPRRLGSASIAGIVYRSASAGLGQPTVVHTPDRPLHEDLDGMFRFPPAICCPMRSYIQYTRKKYGYSITTVMSTRGCPFRCEFCSNVVFGGSYRERSAANVVDEIEAALRLGYDRISFADDVFTMKRERVVAVCREIRRRGLDFQVGMPGPRGCAGFRHGLRDETGRLHARLLRNRIRQQRNPRAA